jgi:hypothetical protein
MQSQRPGGGRIWQVNRASEVRSRKIAQISRNSSSTTGCSWSKSMKDAALMRSLREGRSWCASVCTATGCTGLPSKRRRNKASLI